MTTSIRRPIHDIDDERAAARARWICGDDPLSYARLLLEEGELDELAVVCRFSLGTIDEPGQLAELEELLAATGRPPAGWDDALVQFANAPSLDAWRELIQWIPEDDLYLRTRASFRRLQQLGVDADLLFECVTDVGLLPDALELIDTGAASPEIIMRRGESSNIPGMYTVLAARSAAARGDERRAVWLAHSARGLAGHDAELVELHICILAAELGDEHRAMLEVQDD